MQHLSGLARRSPSAALLCVALFPVLLVAAGPESAEQAQKELYAARYKHAAELYADLLKKDPDWAPGYYGLVRALIGDEHAREAYTVAGEGLRRLPKAPETLTASGFAAFRRGELLKAEEFFNKARQVSPQYPGALEGLGDISACVSHFKSARDLYLAAYERSPNNPDLLKVSADARKGPEHIAALEQALALLDPASREARSLRIQIAADKALGGRKVRQLTSPYQPYNFKLLKITPDGRRVRGLGVAVRLNDRQTVRLLLDTGASGISISPKAAEKAGLEVLSSETGEGRGIGDDKPVSASRFLAASVEIGGLSFSNYVVSAFRSAKDSDIDGLIGADVFRRFLITIDFPRAEMSLEPFATQPPPADEPEDAPPVPAGFFRAIRAGTHLMVFTDVNDRPRNLFLIDSGASVNIIDAELAAEVTKVRGDDRTVLHGIQGRVKDVSRADRITLTFAGFRQENPSLLAVAMEKQGDSLGIGIGGIIGMPVLWNLKMTIDYRAGAIRMARAT